MKYGDPEIDFARKLAAGLEQVLIAALTNNGPERAKLLLRKFIYADDPSHSRETLICMVVASLADTRILPLLPEEFNLADLPPMSSLAAQYRLQNAFAAAQEQPNPALRKALFQRASEMATDRIEELGEAAGIASFDPSADDASDIGRAFWRH